MTAVQPSLFLPGWQEECGGADERAVVDLHGPQPERRRIWWPEGWPMPDAWVGGRPAYNVAVSIDQWPEGAAA